MKYPIYCYRDVKVGFLPPQCDQNDATAIRGFSFAINGNDGIMNYSPKDFDLYRIGEFDSDTGMIVSENPVVVATGINVLGDKT